MEKKSKSVRRSWSDAASFRPTFTISKVPQNGVNGGGDEKGASTSSSSSRPSTPTPTSPTTKTAATSTSTLPTEFFQNGGSKNGVENTTEGVTLIVPTIELPVFGTFLIRNFSRYLRVTQCGNLRNFLSLRFYVKSI